MQSSKQLCPSISLVLSLFAQSSIGGREELLFIFLVLFTCIPRAQNYAWPLIGAKRKPSMLITAYSWCFYVLAAILNSLSKISLESSEQSYQEGTVVISIFEKRELSPRVVKGLDQGCTARRLQCWDWNPGSLTAKYGFAKWMNGAQQERSPQRLWRYTLRPAFPGLPAHTPTGPAPGYSARLGGGVGTQQVWVYSPPHGGFPEVPPRLSRWGAGH